MFCNQLLIEDCDLEAVQADLELTQWLEGALKVWMRDHEKLSKLEAVTRRFNEVARYFLGKKAKSIEDRNGEKSMNNTDERERLEALELEMTDVVENFLMEPVDYTRVFESGLSRTDAHDLTAWWLDSEALDLSHSLNSDQIDYTS
jgi:hypothetical protein